MNCCQHPACFRTFTAAKLFCAYHSKRGTRTTQQIEQRRARRVSKLAHLQIRRELNETIEAERRVKRFAEIQAQIERNRQEDDKGVAARLAEMERQAFREVSMGV